MKSSILLPFTALSLITVTGCVPVVVAGAGAAAGIAAAQEGGVKAAVSDTSIRANINDYWFKYNADMFSKLNLTVDQGRVLITGVVQQPEHRVEAVRLAWQAKGVKQVINEIQVGQSGTVGSYAKDKWITSSLRSQMLFNKNIQSINYTIDTVQGAVYLMGVAQSQAELDRVIGLARRISGVKQVVSYVKLVGEPIASVGSQTEGEVTSVSSATAAGGSQDASAPAVQAAPLDPVYSNQTAGSAAPPAGIEAEVLPP